jgi:signal transduction histidine kinase
MAVPSSPGQAAHPAASRSIDFYFGAGLIGPLTGLLAAWGVVAGIVLSGTLQRLRWLAQEAPGQRALIGTAVIAGTGLIVVLAAVIMMGRFTRLLSRETERLAATARHLADERLPRTVEALRDGENGEQAAADAGTAPPPQMPVAELASAAAAVARLHHAAVASAAAEAGLRNGFREILVSLGKRNQSLLHRQLRIIDTLEQQASSPTALAELFTLDHLTTRMRRHAESLTILSGAASGRAWSGPVQVIDVMRAAAAEVEDYTRVTVISDSEEAVAASAVTDMIHLLAELIENATLFSPSSTRVEVRGEHVANGFAIEIEDRGLGIPPDQLRQLNAQLADPPDFHLADADRLGLFVAARLAARHGVQVSLSPSPYRGTKAVVVLPDGIAVAPSAADNTYTERTLRDSAQLNLRAPEVLSLAGAHLPGLSGPASADGGASAASPAEKPAPSTVHGLPRRVRPDSQPDGSEAASRADGPAPRHAPVEAPAPEAARTLAASLQSSWHRSRRPDGPADSERPATWPDAIAPDSASGNASESENSLWLLRPRAALPREISRGCWTTWPSGWRISAGR